MLYRQRAKNQAVADNLKTLMQLRHELPAAEKLYPLPFFYMEKRVLLGQLPALEWRAVYCPHGRFTLNYFDVFAPKRYRNLLYEGEHKNIENSKMLKPERAMIHQTSFFLNKLLLGTTLLPKAVVDCIFEGVGMNNQHADSLPARDKLYKAWEQPKCELCMEYYNKVKKRREVERYLFLKYQSKAPGNP